MICFVLSLKIVLRMRDCSTDQINNILMFLFVNFERSPSLPFVAKNDAKFWTSHEKRKTELLSHQKRQNKTKKETERNGMEWSQVTLLPILKLQKIIAKYF